MLKIRVLKQIVSFLIILTLLIGVMPTTRVEAADANFMAAQMINFFKTANKINDVNTLSPDEIQVYAVFLSNFYKPGLYLGRTQ